MFWTRFGGAMLNLKGFRSGHPDALSKTGKETTMLFKSISRNVSMLTLVGLLSAGLVAGDTVTVKQLELEKEGIELIAQLEGVARDIHYNSDRLNSLTGSTRDAKWTHYHHLTQIKELVNDGLRQALDRLTEIQPQLKGWHQGAIDRMLSSAQALAADTNSAILNQNEKGMVPAALNREFKELVSRIDQHAETLVKTADAAGDYAAARERAEEAGLKLPRQE